MRHDLMTTHLHLGMLMKISILSTMMDTSVTYFKQSFHTTSSVLRLVAFLVSFSNAKLSTMDIFHATANLAGPVYVKIHIQQIL